MDGVIQLHGVSKSFGKRPLLKQVNVEIMPATITGFLGENGCGKSVLFKLISGLYRPDEGSIIVNGERIGDKFGFPPDMGIFIDAPGFILMYSGLKNLQYLAEIQKKIGRDKIEETMSLVGLDYKDPTHVKNYSLGMKQKLGIAQAIMEDQSIILLDEPFNALDAESHTRMLGLIKELKKQGKTILLTSHNFNDITQLCDIIYQIKDCKIAPYVATA